MTIEELRNKIFDIFEEKGFHAKYRENRKINEMGNKWYWDNGDLNGYTIDITNVHKHNGADEDVSIDIEIYQWKNNSGKPIAKERVRTGNSDKIINNRINKIINIYNTL